MAIFDFLANAPRYESDPRSIARLNKRYEFLIAPFAADVAGARVLDLASHDGRWSYAFAATGAASVTGIEGRQNLIDEFEAYPKDADTAKIMNICGDVFDVMEDMIRKGETYDVIGCLGLFYHIADHHRLLMLMHRLCPKLIILDSLFHTGTGPTIRFSREEAAKDLNAIAAIPNQTRVLVGTPSKRWLTVAAETLGYHDDWVDWAVLAENDRAGVWDYFKAEPKIRATVALRPK